MIYEFGTLTDLEDIEEDGVITAASTKICIDTSKIFSIRVYQKFNTYSSGMRSLIIGLKINGIFFITGEYCRYGDTDEDFDTWDKISQEGDEYAKSIYNEIVQIMKKEAKS